MGPPALLLFLLAFTRVVGSPQKPGVVADQGILILHVDPCKFLSIRRTGGQPGERIDGKGLHALIALGCLVARSKREYSAEYQSPEQPRARETRGLFKTTSGPQGGLLYPGTKWCGPGNTAHNYWDLGKLAEEDRCCREHDYCPQSILAGRCSHGLCNRTPFTRSHCACDERFRKCLQAIQSPAADTIGGLYFNVGKIICFAEDVENNDLQVNTGDADMEERREFDDEAFELGPSGEGSNDTPGQGQRFGCPGLKHCRYKFYTQRKYTATAEVDNILPTAAQRPGVYSCGPLGESNFKMDKRGAVDHPGNFDYRAEEFLSKFLHHILRSTGVLRPRKRT